MWSEHLSDTTPYREVPSYLIHAKQVQLKYKIDAFTTAIQGKLPEHELIFFSRLRKQAYDKLISKFYITAKVGNQGQSSQLAAHSFTAF